MIEPSQDRLDYSAILAPPEEGFELDIAVATTYSLDLSALMAALLPLGFGGDSLGDCRDNPVFMLHALKKILPKLYVFCDASEIKYPDTKEHKLLHMLDQAVFPINHKDAFHPKFWLLKYIKEKEAHYRFVVLSKNISFDRSWDVAMYFDGIPQDTLGNGAPLADMLEYLKKTQWGKSRLLSRISTLADEIKNVTFSNGDIKPESLYIVPLGINKKQGDLPFQAKCDRILVLSPFLSASSVANLFKRTDGRKMLFSRKEALSKIPQDCLEGIECYCIRDEIYNGEQSDKIVQTATSWQNQDIHAKVYMLQGGGAKQELYIGSSNLTENGLKGRNIELLVGMKIRYHNVFESMCKDLLHEGKDDAAFERYQPEAPIEDTESEKKQKELKVQFKKFLSEMRFEVKLIEKEEKRFDVYLTNKKCISFKCAIEIVPIGGGSPRSFAPEQNLPKSPESISFERLPLESLSNFYSITMSLGDDKLKRIIFIDTIQKNILEGRDEAIEKTCLNNTGLFLEYLSYMLADDAYSDALQYGSSAKRGYGLMSNNTSISGLYEKMLSCAAKEPSRLQKIKDIINRSEIADADLGSLLQICNLFCKVTGDMK